MSIAAADWLERTHDCLTTMMETSYHPSHKLQSADIEQLREAFPQALQVDVPLKRYTSSRVGGPADALLEVTSAKELAEAARTLWQAGLPFLVLGGGSNLLVADRGVRGVVVLNRARRVRFDENANPPTVWAESGANFGLLARQTAGRGLGGLEWAAGIPGTLGGAVVGNAGAHGGDMAGNLVLANILHQEDGELPKIETWNVEQLDYGYRSSALKRNPGHAVVLSTLLRLERTPPQAIQARMNAFLEQRHRTQPPGASMGSMFKNPRGDYAGRLIEAAGLKGARVGKAQISQLHANFFTNLGGATAADILSLIQMARREVAEQLGVSLELEIELVGEWPQSTDFYHG